jgi:hypothetical protein
MLARFRAWVQGLRQPWRFVYYGVGFGVVSFVVSGGDLGRALLGGVLFATLLSLWDAYRQRRGQPD